MGHRRGHGAGFKAETPDKAQANTAVAAVALDNRHFGQVGLDPGCDLAVHHRYGDCQVAGVDIGFNNFHYPDLNPAFAGRGVDPEMPGGQRFL
ncbi:hypothetical protein MOLA_18390 [Moorella thermoacetica]|nr:hypothetical protein MOLA_18390 [Moorella thermoacetica]